MEVSLTLSFSCQRYLELLQEKGKPIWNVKWWQLIRYGCVGRVIVSDYYLPFPPKDTEYVVNWDCSSKANNVSIVDWNKKAPY